MDSIRHFNRPNKLTINVRPPLTHHQVTPSDSPINSPPGGHRLSETQCHRWARKCANKRLIFQLSVVAPLTGALLLFIGLVQLTPGAERGSYGMPLINVGAGVLGFGFIIIFIRVICKWVISRRAQLPDVPEIRVDDTSQQVETEFGDEHNKMMMEQRENGSVKGDDENKRGSCSPYSKCEEDKGTPDVRDGRGSTVDINSYVDLGKAPQDSPNDNGV